LPVPHEGTFREFRRCGASGTQVRDGYRISSVPSVPGVEVGASWLGGCEHVPTAGAPGLLAALHETFGPGRAATATISGAAAATSAAWPQSGIAAVMPACRSSPADCQLCVRPPRAGRQALRARTGRGPAPIR
jgi:hypothetical protein